MYMLNVYLFFLQATLTDRLSINSSVDSNELTFYAQTNTVPSRTVFPYTVTLLTA